MPKQSSLNRGDAIIWIRLASKFEERVRDHPGIWDHGGSEIGVIDQISNELGAIESRLPEKNHGLKQDQAKSGASVSKIISNFLN